MVRDQGPQATDQVAVTPELELSRDEEFDGREVELLDLGDGRLGEGVEAEVGKRRAAPELERLQQPCFCAQRSLVGERLRPLLEQPLEAVQVELLGLYPDQVAVRSRDDDTARRAVTPVGPLLPLERPAQARDLHLDVLRGAFVRIV